ncbi:MAG: hypothetical protein P4L53_00805 [Candidatus Obscuribacterales bacterium]|nr:hypothetical protein [Candidatus Obscuribacterales bacterium]
MKNALSRIPVLLISALLPLAAQAAPVAQAAVDEIDSQALDPNGFKLMTICIAMLVFLALSLIGGVIFYFVKSKKMKG